MRRRGHSGAEGLGLRKLARLLVATPAALAAALVWAALAGGTQQYETYEAGVAASGPVAQFRFDDAVGSTKLVDSAGSFTASNSGITLGAEGPFGGSKSGSFAGSALATLPSDPLKEASAFTAEAWVDWAGGSSYGQPIFDFASSSSNYMYLTPASSASKHPLLFEIHTGSGTAAVTATKLGSKSWEYVAVSETSSGTVTLYLNGEPVAEATKATISPASLGASVPDDYLGAGPLGSSEPRFSGSLSNVAFYTKALTAGEIKAHYDDAEFPVNASPPTISGTAKDGKTLTAKEGSWIGLPVETWKFQWELCNGSGAGCAGIPEATGSTLLLGHGDVEHTLRVAVTAKNKTGKEGTATSAATAVVAAIKPSSLTVPVISGVAEVGQELSVSDGTWEGSPPTRYAYEWQTCNSVGEKCKANGGTGQVYEPLAAQVSAKDRLRAVVTAENSAGSASATSAVTGVVTAGPPRAKTPPAISGTASEGGKLTASEGSWVGTEPITLKHEWQRCSEGKCTTVGTGLTYEPSASDVGSTLKFVVTATNSAGEASASAMTGVVTGPPRNTQAPTIEGTATEGSKLTGGKGVWAGTQPISYEYEWQRCSEGKCTTIASGSTYEPTSADVGSTLKFVVTAKNSVGETKASVTSGVVTGPPRNTGAPTIEGTATEGGKLTGGKGVWAGTQPISYEYEWQRCSEGKCTTVASGTSYEPTAADVGSTLKFIVTAKSSLGEASASEMSGVVTGPPRNTGAPTIEGTATEGGKLTGGKGVWAGTQPISYEYEWQSCLEDTCSGVGTSVTYEPTSSDVGNTLKFIVTAKNSVGQAKASAVSGVVTGPPRNTEPPVITGEAKAGQVLSASTGRWLGTGPIEYEYHWQSCDVLGESCMGIAGAVGSSYTVQSSDIGATLRVSVTASNAVGSASSESAATEEVAGGEAGPLVYSSEFGAEGSGAGQFDHPADVVVAGSGHIWVLDQGNDRVEEFTQNGEFIRQFGSEGSGEGQLISPDALAISPEGNIWVADTGNERAEEFSPEGAFIRTAGNGILAEGIAVAHDGDVWLSDTYEGQLVVLSSTGEYLKTVGTPGSEPGQLEEPEGLAVGPQGDIWTADWSNDRVDAFNEEGTLVEQFGSDGSEPGQLSLPYGIAVDGSGHVFVAEPGNDRVQELAEDGRPIAELGSSGSEPGELNLGYPVGLASTSSGGLWVTDSGNDRLELWVPGVASPPENVVPPTIVGVPTEGEPLSATPGTWSAPAPIYRYQWLRCDGAGSDCADIAGATSASYTPTHEDIGDTLAIEVTATNVSGSASSTSSASEVVATGIVETGAFGGGGWEAGRFDRPTALATDLAGDLLVLDQGNDRVERFDQQGDFLRQFGSEGSGLGELNSPTGIAVNSEGDVWIANFANERLEKLNEEGTRLQTVNLGYRPERLAIGAGNDLWVTNTSYRGEATEHEEQLVVYNEHGEYMRTVGAAGSGYGELVEPRDVASGTNGDMWVADDSYLGAKVVEFTEAGEPIAQWVPRNRAGEAVDAYALALGSEGHVWVTGSEAKVYEYTQSGEFLRAFSASYEPAESEYDERQFIFGVGLLAAPGGGVWVTDSDGDRVERLALDEGSAPSDSTAPAITGSAIEYQSLRAQPGTWTRMPVAYGYQWQRCDGAGGSCAAIAGASSSVYVPTGADVGHTLRVVVSASDPAGSSSSTSAATALMRGAGAEQGGCTVFWVGPQRGEWGDAANWSTGGVPGPSDDVCVPTGVDVEIDTGANQVQALEDEGELTLTGGSLELTSPLKESTVSSMTLEHATLTGAAGLTITHGLEWGTEGEMAGTGTTTIGHEATALLHSAGYQGCDTLSISRRTLVNRGQIRIRGTQRPYVGEYRGVNVYMSEGARLENAGTFIDNSACEEMRPNPAAKGVDPAFWNGGAFLRTLTGDTRIRVHFSDQGAVDLTHGQFFFEAGGIPGEVAEGTWRDTAGGEQIIIFRNRTEYDPAPFLLRQGVSLTEGVGYYTAPVRIPFGGPSADSAFPPYITGDAVGGDTLSINNGNWSGEEPLSYGYQWQRCNSVGGECANIAGATASTYTLPEGDAGLTLRVLVTGTNSRASVTAPSRPSEVIAPGVVPANTSPPTLTGSVALGARLSVTTGSWSGSEPLTYSYLWEACNVNGEECTAILGAESSSYVVGPQEVGDVLRVAVTASNEAGSATARVATAAAAIANTGEPRILGVAQVGAQLTGLDGSWSGAVPLTFTHQWLTCDGEGLACTEIEGATGSIYTPAETQLGATLRLRVTAENGEGTSTATSAPTPVVVAEQIASKLPPTVAGVAEPGGTLTAAPGLWDGPAPLSYVYQWERCNDEGEECATIAGATQAEYVVPAEALGATLRVSVTASNGSASARAASEATSQVVELPPANTLSPSISGAPNVGSTLQAQSGGWSGDGLVYSYQWESCGSSPDPCVAIAGADEATYIPQGAEVGETLRVIVSATNALGSAAVASARTSAIRPELTLVDSVAPSVAGAAQVDVALQGDPGSWLGRGALSYSYQWQTCDTGEHCSDIAGADTASYAPSTADVGHPLELEVTATDDDGSVSESSAPTQPVAQANAPADASPPSISGAAQAGQALSASPGTWLSASEPSYEYQWEACAEGGIECEAIAGAHGADYTPSRTDIGRTLRVLVTASNTSGTSTASSSASGPISGSFEDVTLPEIVAATGQEPTLTANPGIWISPGTPSYAYQWRRCDAAGGACTDVSEATGQSYTETSQDARAVTLRVAVTATVPGRSIEAESAAYAPTGVPTIPWIAGGTVVGDTLAAEVPPDEGAPQPTYTYQWQRCEASGEGCKEIPGASASAYTIQSADVGLSLVVAVHASSEAGGASQSSKPVWIGSPSLPHGPVTIGGGEQPVVGATLQAQASGVVGSEPIAAAYRWERCESGGSECNSIAGATGGSYTIGAADIGDAIRLAVTSTNAYGMITSTSASTSVIGHSAPGLLEPPQLTWLGALEPGTTVTASAGSWGGDAPIDYEYQWQQCDAEGGSCTPIESAVGDNYTIEAPLAGHSLAVIVTASNGLGSSRATAGGAGYLVHATSGAPGSIAAPTIEGTPRQGQPVTATPGMWSNAPSGTTYSYQWLECRTERPELEPFLGEFHDGRACTPIEGANSATYTPTAAEVGLTLMVEVTAENSAELTGTEFSAPSAVVLPGAPVDTALPVISGEVVAGNILSATRGRWEDGEVAQATYSWLQCDGSGEDCAPIPGATDSEYKLPTGATGTLRAAVTVPGAGGSTTAESAPTSAIAAASEPIDTVAPAIAGRAQDGATLTASVGTWSGSPELSYSYEWQRCDPAGTECASIAGAGEATYQLTRADVGHTILLTVAASNGAGARTASSEPTDTVASAEAPTELIAPRIAQRSAADGESLVVEEGAWSGDVEASERWERCNPKEIDPETEQQSCSVIPGATGPLYTASAADIGYELRVTETATNEAGTASSTTAMTDVVGPELTSDEGADYTGELVVGHTITALATAATIPALPSSSEYEFVGRTPGGGRTTLQAGAEPTYTIASADLHDELEITVHTTFLARGNGEVVYTATDTTPTETIRNEMPPRSIPTISGAFAVGSALEAGNGHWASRGLPTTYSYQWQSCDESGQSCQPIPRATGEELLLEPGMAGHTLRVEVTAVTEEALGTEVSEPTPAISAEGGPHNLSAPAISGTPQAGQALTASPGTWSSGGAIAYRYRWMLCTEPEVPCSAIAGNQQQYTPHGSDVGGTLQVEVTAIGQSGMSRAASPATATIAKGAPPTNTVPPAITVIGPATSEAVLATTGGAWQHLEAQEGPEAGQANEQLEYQWERCNAEGLDCEPITGSTQPVYDASLADVGSRDRVAASAKTSGGELRVLSAPGPLIAGSNASARNALVFVQGEEVDLAGGPAEGPRAILRCDQLESVTGEARCAFGHPTISPSGQVIAVEARPLTAAASCSGTRICPDADNSSRASVVLVNYDGSDPHALPIQAGQPAWEPDSSGLLVTRTTEGVAGPISELERVSLSEPDAPKPIALPAGVESAQSPSVSAGGAQTAFVGKSAATGEWNLYVAEGNGENADEATFAGLDNVDEPILLPVTEEGQRQEVVFSATPTSGTPPKGYESTRPRVLYVAPVTGGQAVAITDPGVDTSAPRLQAGGESVVATRRSPGESGLTTSAWEIDFRQRSEPSSYQILSEATEPVEASPATLSESYSTEQHPVDAVRAAGVRSDVLEATPHETAPEDNALAREFEPTIYVDESDGFLPVSEEWMLKLDKFGANGFGRSELCASTCQHVPYNTELGPTTGAEERIRYPESNYPVEAERTTINAMVEWTDGLFHLRSQADQEAEDFDDAEIQESFRHVYYVIVHRHGLLTIDYWYYYTFNFFNGSLGENCQSQRSCSPAFHDLHQGDWENVEVVLNHPQIGPYQSYSATQYVVSRHGAQDVLAPSEIHLENGTHLRVAAAQGDHAMYQMCPRHGERYTEETFPVAKVLGVSLEQDRTCSHLYERPFLHQGAESGLIAVGGGRGWPLEDLASRNDIAKFSCWNGLFGYQRENSFERETGAKVLGESPRAPLRQLDPALKESDGHLCPTREYAD